MTRTKICRVAGYNMAYHRSGSGEPVILIHGITTYSFIWRNITPLLEPDYDVITPDLLGCGESDMPLNESYAIKVHADRIYEFANTLGIRKFHFVGHDLGGGIGQIFAVRHPEMLYSLTMINTVAFDFWPVQPITALRTPIVRQLMMASFDLGTFKMIVKRGVFHRERVTAELMDFFMMPMQTSAGRKAFMHFARCLDNHNLLEIADDLRKLKTPVLIIRGDADPYLSSTIAEKLHREIPGSRLKRIATGGHWIQEDEPEQIARELIGFMKEHHA